MFVLKIVTSGILGTLLMTLFSYVCGQLFSKEFGEPKLLNALLYRASNHKNKTVTHALLGWILHLCIGIVFAFFLYSYFEWKNRFGWRESLPNLYMAAILGFLLGLLGVMGWTVLLKIHHSPPKIELPEFYIQLVVAHIIFGLGTVLSFGLFL